MRIARIRAAAAPAVVVVVFFFVVDIDVIDIVADDDVENGIIAGLRPRGVRPRRQGMPRDRTRNVEFIPACFVFFFFSSPRSLFAIIFSPKRRKKKHE
jgi:hypothetical protein